MKETFSRLLGGILTASLLAMAFMGIFPYQIVHAAATTYTVNSLTDSGDGICDSDSCSLRDAILAANANSGADTILFSVSGTILLTSALPGVTESLSIDGTGQKIILDGNNQFAILGFYFGGVDFVYASLNNLTLQNGRGGIYNTAFLTITNSTFIANQRNYGGAIANFSNLTVVNSSFYNNQATDSMQGNGGAIYSQGDHVNMGGTLTLLNSSFSENKAISGGGIYVAYGGFDYANTIVANSTGGDCVSFVDIGTNSHNLVEDGSCSASLSGDPKLDALANNGGFTPTFNLLVASPARDAGDDAICAAAPVNNLDQRGALRPIGPHCDIGSFEAPQLPVITLTPGALTFAEQVIGTTSAAKGVVLTYIGPGSLQIGTLGINGQFSFVPASDTCSGKTLVTNGTCSFKVVFSPTTVGAKTGNVAIPSNAFSSPDSLALNGKGVSPKVGLSATSLSFGPQYIGTVSASQTVTITNTGTGRLKLGTLHFSGDFWIRGNTCNGASLPVGGTCAFGVVYSPTKTDSTRGTITIPSNAVTSPSRITLRGTVRQGTQLLKMANFDTSVTPLPWKIISPQNNLVILRDCSVFFSPSCSAKFKGSQQSPVLSAAQMIIKSGAAGDKYYISLSSRAEGVPPGGQYKFTVLFYNIKTMVGSKTLVFSNGTHDFQTREGVYTAPGAYTYIYYKIVYQKTGGIAWFDNAALIKIP